MDGVETVHCHRKHTEEKFIMGNVKRIYVEKKEPFAVKAKELKEGME